MSLSRRETTVNGNRTQIWSCDDEAATRRLAASLERADDRVDRVMSSTCYDAEVWLANDEVIRAPDGWVIDSVFNAPNGGTAIRFTEDA
jgi:hypothetical protein